MIKLLQTHAASFTQEAYFFYLLGLALVGKKDLLAAEEHYKQAITFDPNNPTYLATLADLYCATDRWDLFEQYLNSAQALDPNLPYVYLVRGKGFLRRSKLTQSIAAFDEALRLNPEHPEALELKALAQTLEQKFDESIETNRIALELNPNSSRALANIGWQQLYAGDHTAAKESFKQALAVDPMSHFSIIGYKAAVCNQSFFYRYLTKLELFFFKKKKLKKRIVTGFGLSSVLFIPFSIYFRPEVAIWEVMMETFALYFLMLFIPFKIIPRLSMLYLITDEYGKTLLSLKDKVVTCISSGLIVVGFGLILLTKIPTFWCIYLMLIGVIGSSLSEKGDTRIKGLQAGAGILIYLFLMYMLVWFSFDFLMKNQ